AKKPLDRALDFRRRPALNQAPAEVARALGPVGIDKTQRVALHENITVYAVLQAFGIGADPPRQPACVVPCSVVVESSFLVPLFPCISIALRRFRPAPHRLIGRPTVGRIFLVENDLRLPIQLQDGRAEVITELVADQLPWRYIPPRLVKRAR